MKFLVWDTSSKWGVLAGFEASGPPFQIGQRVAEFSLSVDTSSHSERLLWAIHQCLAACNWDLKEVDVFGVGLGPGSFTGLRIGMTTARTLAHVLQKPLIGVSSLAALAYPVAHYSSARDAQKVLVIAATDACKGELFALWANAADLHLGKYTEAVLSPQVLVDRLLVEYSEQVALCGEKVGWIVLGEGRQRYAEQWARLPQDAEITQRGFFQSSVTARALAQLVFESYIKNQNGSQSPCDPLLVFPNYLRASDAEVRLKARTVLMS